MIFFQCIGIAIEVCWATGLALALICICAGREFIVGNGDARLNAVLLNFPVSACFQMLQDMEVEMVWCVVPGRLIRLQLLVEWFQAWNMEKMVV